jgi:hypothetical protein
MDRIDSHAAYIFGSVAKIGTSAASLSAKDHPREAVQLTKITFIFTGFRC